MNGVAKSFVSAMTQTPASGPALLRTTPLMYPCGADRCNPCRAVMGNAANRAVTAISPTQRKAILTLGRVNIFIPTPPMKYVHRYDTTELTPQYRRRCYQI